jgi:hypothetical protein
LTVYSEAVAGLIASGRACAARSSASSVDGTDFDELSRRTQGRSEVLERRRLRAAATGLSHPDGPATPRGGMALVATG